MKTGFKNVGLFVAGAAIMLGVVWYVERNKANQTGKVIETGSSVKLPENANIVRTSFASVPQNIDFVDAAERTVNAVVHIRTEFDSKGYSSNDIFGTLHEYFNGSPYHENQPMMVGFGSGVVIAQDGYIVTNNHVVEGADKIEVTFNDKRKLMAEIVGTDPSTDLALIKVSGGGFDHVIYGDSDKVKVGEWVLAVGNPFNLTSTVTAGIVSAKARNINILGSGSSIESFIQTDAAINRGNSGGALVNTLGELIGINAAIASQTGGYEGYSFAIPSNIVRKVVDDLIRYGEPKRAYMGVEIREMTSELADEIGQKNIKGVYIARTVEGGGAAEAGIKPGDIVTRINGSDVNSLSQLLEAVGQHRPGDNVSVVVNRESKDIEFQVVLKNQDGTTTMKKSSESFYNDRLAVTLEQLTSADKSKLGIKNGLKVATLSEGVLLRGGISKGFIITIVNGQSVDNQADIDNALSNSSNKTIRVQGMYPNGMKISFEFFN
jgi:Do/DeqQ family serine protease